MNSKPPCLECKKRAVGCHSTCFGKGSYQEWREWKNRVNEKRAKEIQVYNDASSIRARGIKNVTRGNRE